ncbi:MAG TPA: FtsQ-type POTRA domain-containing protein [Candidatus Limnocylindrales bacterium]
MTGGGPRTTIGRGARRPTPVIRRASAGPVAGRVVAGIVLVAAAAALYGMTASPAFRLRDDGVVVRGAEFTGEAAVLEAIGLAGDERPNLFALDTGRLAANLLALPAVDTDRSDAAAVRVALPDRLVVEVKERVPIMVWQVGDRRLLVDVHGVVVSELAASATSDLPVIEDERPASAELAVGDRVSTTDLEVARRVAALTPAFLGSAAESLVTRITENDGFVLAAQPRSWRAVFGIYSSTLRGADLVETQAQCLSSVLYGQEAKIAVVYLFPDAGRCGTFLPRTE